MGAAADGFTLGVEQNHLADPTRQDDRPRRELCPSVRPSVARYGLYGSQIFRCVGSADIGPKAAGAEVGNLIAERRHQTGEFARLSWPLSICRMIVSAIDIIGLPKGSSLTSANRRATRLSRSSIPTEAALNDPNP